jgi:hypothetical protein
MCIVSIILDVMDLLSERLFLTIFFASRTQLFGTFSKKPKIPKKPKKTRKKPKTNWKSASVFVNRDFRYFCRQDHFFRFFSKIFTFFSVFFEKLQILPVTNFRFIVSKPTSWESKQALLPVNQSLIRRQTVFGGGPGTGFFSNFFGFFRFFSQDPKFRVFSQLFNYGGVRRLPDQIFEFSKAFEKKVEKNSKKIPKISEKNQGFRILGSQLFRRLFVQKKDTPPIPMNNIETSTSLSKPPSYGPRAGKRN